MLSRRCLGSVLLVALLTACNPAKTTRDATRDCPDCPEMVVISAGSAIVGSSAADRFASTDEMPERTFEVREPFAVSRYEVTREQYEAFVRATNREVHGNCLTDRVKRGDWQLDAGTTFRDPGFSQRGDHPVACVSWEDAQAYVSWLNEQSQGGYRLLTEDEWEYVARAGSTRNARYPWGDEPDDACPFANGFDATAMQTYAAVMDTSAYKVFDPVQCTDGWLNTAPVGSLKPNAFGIYDMIGNVSEWVEDCHRPSRAVQSPAAASAATCTRRLAKGGSWGTLAHNARTAERLPYSPTHRDDSIGIRVARTLR